MENTILQTETGIITPGMIKDNWQGHRRLTRRAIEAFPEDKLFSFSIGGMRPFSELAIEMLTMAVPGVEGVLTGKWKGYAEMDAMYKGKIKTKEDILQLWDEATEFIDRVWPQIPPQRFLETDSAFGTYEGQVAWSVQYWIDNEIHHRGQGYVYLRALGIEPPPFWDR